jgi:hypothetical protein
MSKTEAHNIKDWIVELQKRGIITFSNEEVKEKFPESSARAIELALNKMISTHSIMPVWKGFYVIIPVQYATLGVVPPVQYIDFLMKHIKRKYYVALLNAAELITFQKEIGGLKLIL